MGADWKFSRLEALPSLAEEGLTSPHYNYLSYKIQALNFIKPIKTSGPGRGASRSPSALGDYGSQLQGQSSHLTVLFLVGSTMKSPHHQPPTKLLQMQQKAPRPNPEKDWLADRRPGLELFLPFCDQQHSRARYPSLPSSLPPTPHIPLWFHKTSRASHQVTKATAALQDSQ